MERAKYKSLATILAAIGLMAPLLVGCGGSEPSDESAQNDSGSAPEMVRRTPPSAADPSSSQSDQEDFRVVPDVDGRLEQDGMGLSTIIDASSKKAYADSLRWIAEDVSARQYQNLERAIRFISAYNSTVLGDEQRLLEYLDGKTGNEVINEAGRLMAQRRGG